MKNKFKWLIGVFAVSAFIGCTDPANSNVTKKGGVVDSTELAIKELSAKIEASPTSPELYIERSKLYQIAGKYVAGYNDALIAVGLDSMKAPNWFEMGKAAFAVENYLRSEEAYKRCIYLDSTSSDCMVKLAEFYLFKRNYQAAVDFANKALTVDVNLARPYYIKGWSYMEKGDTLKAVSSYQTAVELDPNFYDAFIMLGNIAMKARKNVALDYFNSAIAVRPSSIEAHYFKGMCLQEQGLYDEAIATYQQITAIDSTNHEAYYNVGYIKLTYANQPDSAMMLFSKAIEMNKNYFEAYYNRGYCKELLGKKELAANDYKLSLGINNNFTLAAEGLKRVQK